MLEKKKKKVWFDQPAQKLLLNRHGSSHIDTNSWNPKQMHLDNYGTTVYNWTSKEAFFKVVVESVWIPYMTIWQKYNMSNLNPWLIFDCMWLWLHEKHHYYYCCGETVSSKHQLFNKSINKSAFFPPSSQLCKWYQSLQAKPLKDTAKTSLKPSWSSKVSKEDNLKNPGGGGWPLTSFTQSNNRLPFALRVLTVISQKILKHSHW